MKPGLRKRCFDLFLTGPAFFVFSPFLVFISIMVRFSMGKPILFRQNRPGLQGNPFKIFKFRTMTNHHGENGRLLPDINRLTRIGRILRSSSLDELPGLFNVLKGDMSIVGPRPLLMQYLDRYTHGKARRHEIKPALTGWAQVNGWNAITWEDKFNPQITPVRFPGPTGQAQITRNKGKTLMLPHGFRYS